MEKIEFDGTKIGLIVRGKVSPEHSPSVLAQHADVILADGSPIGFFGEGEPHSSGSSASLGSGVLNSTGMNMQGAVYDHPLFALNYRAAYVDLELAKSAALVSTLLVIEVSKTEAELFTHYWINLKAHPGLFNMIGYNCSTRASQGFIQSGIVPGGIPGMDTPNNLYTQISTLRSKQVKSYSGYIGFSSRKNGTGFDVFIEPAK